MSAGRRIGLRWKFLAVTAVALAAVGLAVGATIHRQAENVIRAELRARSHALVVGLADQHAFSTFMEDWDGLKAIAPGLVGRLPDVVYVSVRSPSGETVAEAHDAEMKDVAVPQLRGKVDTAGEDDVRYAGLPVLDIQAPITFLDEGKLQRVGTIQIGIRTDGVDAQLARILRNALGAGVAAFLVCLAAVGFLSRLLTNPIERLSLAAAAIAGGDLRRDVEIKGNDEIAETGESFRAMCAALRSVLADLQGAAGRVESEATRILATASEQAGMASQQASAIAETSTTVSEIAQTAKQATEHADGVITTSKRSEDLSRDGQAAVEDAKHGIDALAEQVRAIDATVAKLNDRIVRAGEIIATVKDVAEQSNILALNAAIEASRAGEHGRGFSVVAAEMRNLAEQSKGAAEQVRQILGEIHGGTRAVADATAEGGRRAQAAIALAESAGAAIVGLAEVIRDSALAARQIANNTRQQTVGVDQIATAMSEISTAMNDSVNGTKRIQEITANLSAVSTELGALVNRWRV